MDLRFEVAHHVPGRLRVRLLGSPTQHVALADAVRQLPYVRTIEHRPPTRSLVIGYAPSAYEEISALLKQFAPELELNGRVAESAGTENDRPYSAIAHALIDAFGEIDRKLRHASGSQFDLRLLFPLGIAIYGLILGSRRPPSWIHLSLLASGLFVAFHPPTATDR